MRCIKVYSSTPCQECESTGEKQISNDIKITCDHCNGVGNIFGDIGFVNISGNEKVNMLKLSGAERQRQPAIQRAIKVVQA